MAAMTVSLPCPAKSGGDAGSARRAASVRDDFPIAPPGPLPAGAREEPFEKAKDRARESLTRPSR